MFTGKVEGGHQKKFENCCDGLTLCPDRISYFQKPLYLYIIKSLSTKQKKTIVNIHFVVVVMDGLIDYIYLLVVRYI